MELEEYRGLDATSLALLISMAEVTHAEAIEAAIRVTRRYEPTINALAYRYFDEARVAAKSAYADPFPGVPMLLKNLLGSAAGTATDAGCKLLKGYTCSRDSEFVARLRRAGLVFLGRTNCPEFGLAPTTEPALHGPTRNPWNKALSSGGSSGGAAAAVAMGYVPIAHGNDGGGSIRIPASCCGVFGLKPTRARNPVGPDYGELVAGLVVENVLTRSVRDAAAMLDVTSGPAPGDPYAAPPPARPFREEIGGDVRGMRIGYTLTSPLGGPVHPDCRAAVQHAANLCELVGCHVEEASPTIDGPGFQEDFTVLWAASAAKSVESVSRGAGVAPEAAHYELLTWALHEIGRGISASKYMVAVESLHRRSRTIARFFGDFDFWLTPTVASPPPALGEFCPQADNPLAAAEKGFRFNPFCLIANATGQPAASIPLYWNAAGLPIGVQVVGRFGEEGALFRLAAALEEAAPWMPRLRTLWQDGI